MGVAGHVIRVSVLVVLAAFAYYPVFLVLSVSFDTLFGDSIFLQDILFGSRRELVFRMLVDWYASLPVGATVGLVSFLALIYGPRRHRFLTVLGLSVVVSLGWGWLVGFDYVICVAIGLASLTIMWMHSLFSRVKL